MARVPQFVRTKRGKHQIRTIDAVHVPKAGPFQQPHQRHAVRRDHTGCVVDAAELLGSRALHNTVDARDANVLPAGLRDPRRYRFDRRSHVDGADLDT